MKNCDHTNYVPNTKQFIILVMHKKTHKICVKVIKKKMCENKYSENIPKIS